MSKSILFLGASTGVGLATLERALTTSPNTTCIALLRDPSKLQSLAAAHPDNLTIIKGNAHSVDDLARALVRPNPSSSSSSTSTSTPSPPGSLVDIVHFSIGVRPDALLRIPDPDVTKKGMSALLEALARIRSSSPSSSSSQKDHPTSTTSKPLISVVSGAGIVADRSVRDYPLALWPLFRLMLGVPHADKAVMEARLLASGERFVVSRPSMLLDTDCPGRDVRVGLQDPRTGEPEGGSHLMGYVVSRQAVGRWIWDNLYSKEECSYEGKGVVLTW
ncbi:hypothetical protein N3K66_007610 [Trichothecium roseum]|uniref:Uncharacterized protein n=1 Tax=Trichothecium roseum TaxID=47278 RepID=A0ACC0UUD9_9HYPO|nr:hypothetical protein N3K66_007610 [Trichothecium roseum]